MKKKERGELKKSLDKATQEYSEARIRLRKSLHKMTYRISKLDDLSNRKYNGLKKELYIKLRKMDSFFRKLMEKQEDNE